MREKKPAKRLRLCASLPEEGLFRDPAIYVKDTQIEGRRFCIFERGDEHIFRVIVESLEPNNNED